MHSSIRAITAESSSRAYSSRIAKKFLVRKSALASY
jgi:hypothetical protein